jgi:hypothetical protein
MPPFLFRAILTASLVICSARAFAESHMIGLGNQTCETWTVNPPIEGVGLLYQQWALGFLSGVTYRFVRNCTVRENVLRTFSLSNPDCLSS